MALRNEFLSFSLAGEGGRPQGNRISDLGEEVCKEIVAPASSFDFASV
jgi:hypothetical protein